MTTKRLLIVVVIFAIVGCLPFLFHSLRQYQAKHRKMLEESRIAETTARYEVSLSSRPPHDVTYLDVFVVAKPGFQTTVCGHFVDNNDNARRLRAFIWSQSGTSVQDDPYSSTVAKYFHENWSETCDTYGVISGRHHDM